MSHPDKTSPVKPKGLTQQQSDFTSEGAPPPTPNSVLNAQAIEAASRDLALGSVTPRQAACRQDVVKLLNDALATELVCVLRYKRHHFTAAGQASAKIAQEFMVHARQEALHADRLARRIVQLNGSPDFSPESLTRRSHAPFAGRHPERGASPCGRAQGLVSDLGRAKPSPLALAAPGPQARSKRSRFITFVHAATKSCTNFSPASALA